MSFKSAISGIELANRALSRIYEEPISSLEPDVPGKAARECRRWYKPTVGWLLERHHWNLATEITPLAQIANTRTDAWRFAYAKPNDAAFIVAVAPGEEGAGQSYYAGLRGRMEGAYGFESIGSTIYTSASFAAARHTRYSVTEDQFDETFAAVIVEHLAARLAMPITRKPSLVKELEQSAANMLVLAMTQNLNANPQTYGNRPTETELTRGTGIVSDYFTGNWPIDPAGIS